MKYAKLIEDNLIPAPNPIVIGDRQIGNPPAEIYLEQGYKPVVYADQPREAPDGHQWVERWTENENTIQQAWVLVEIPVSEEVALVRYANELTGKQDETMLDATETLIKIVKEEN